MKNVQIIDGAKNCSYAIYAMTDDEFLFIFGSSGRNVEFIEDVIERSGDLEVGEKMKNVWNRPVKKIDAIGIHGTLFDELLWKKKYYPNKKDEDLM